MLSWNASLALLLDVNHTLSQVTSASSILIVFFVSCLIALPPRLARLARSHINNDCLVPPPRLHCVGGQNARGHVPGVSKRRLLGDSILRTKKKNTRLTLLLGLLLLGPSQASLLCNLAPMLSKVSNGPWNNIYMGVGGG